MTGQKSSRKWAALLGTSKTKRTVYFEHAARELGLHVLFIGWNMWKEGFWEEWLPEHRERGMIKIDPPSSGSADLKEADALAKAYRRQLNELSELRREHPISFFNDPDGIAALLDKPFCKKNWFSQGFR